VARPQPIEAPSTTSQPQQTPEDIDREVKRIQETVKGEFRRAQDGSLGA
jgi:predicted AAA+ superfamily ATPase